MTRRCGRHYADGAPPDWQARHISAYAASHPWEDWAETFAHYLHITDTLEMVHALNFPLGRLETAQPNELAQRRHRRRLDAGRAGGGTDRPNRSQHTGALAGAVGSVELDQPLHGPARPLSLRHFRRRGRASSNSCMS